MFRFGVVHREGLTPVVRCAYVAPGPLTNVSSPFASISPRPLVRNGRSDMGRSC